MKQHHLISLVLIILITNLQTLLAQSTVTTGYSKANNSLSFFTNAPNNILEAYSTEVDKQSSKTKILNEFEGRKRKSTAAKVYPNPAQQVLNIKAAGFNVENLQIEIVDLTGRVVQKIKPKTIELQLEISNLKAGNYLLYLTDCSQSVVEKFVKTNQNIRTQ